MKPSKPLLKRLQGEVRLIRERQSKDYSRYRNDPVAYCTDVLLTTLTDKQQAILNGLVTPPYRVLCSSGHNVGKSFVGACAVCWWYDTRNPSVCLTTAPTDRQVKDILWKEVRKLRGRAGLGGFAGPKIPRLESTPLHFAHGFTARDANAFQGQHELEVFILFDEAEGVDSQFWEAAPTMLGPTDPFLAIYNPLSTASQAYLEEQEEGYHQLNISCLEHPNIQSELRGEPPPYPSAIRLERLRELLRKWATPLCEDEEPCDFDIHFDGQWWRPGPLAEARLLGRRPGQSINSVWSEYAWRLATLTILPDTGPLQIGCDVARYGDDDTTIHIRKGGVSLHHEAANGRSTTGTVERLQWLADHWGRRYRIEPKRVSIVVDDAGVGGGVTDQGQAEGWQFIPHLGAWAAPDDTEYPNMRSALWFGMAEAAAAGNVSLVRLPDDVLANLKRQFMAVTYTLDLRGRRVVESKDRTKERIRRSPDDADAVLLAYANVALFPERVAGIVQVAR